jgi:hypothetical protein
MSQRLPYRHFYAVSSASCAAAEAWQPHATDVIVATYTKCGTTLLQMLLEMLRTGGNVEFEEITAVQPWIDFCLDVGVDPCAAQRALPRVFKSHQPIRSLDSNCRVASVLRSPAAVLKSYHAFYTQKKLVDAPIDEWATTWADTGTWDGHVIWEYYAQLWERRAELRRSGAKVGPPTSGVDATPFLLLSFNALVGETEEHAWRVAEWLDAARDGEEARATRENVERAAKLCSRSAMAAMASQFDDHWLHERQVARGSATVMPPAVKVIAEKDRAHARATLAPETTELLARTWAERVSPRTGLASWEEMEVALAEDHAAWRSAFDAKV